MNLGNRLARTGVLLLVLSSAAAGQGDGWPQLRTVEAASGFVLPVDIQNAGDGSGRLFVVEQAGRIRVIEGGQVLPEPFLDIRSRVRSGGERGLLGLVFAPDFAQSGVFYVNYTEGAGAPDLRTVIARYRVSTGARNRADAANEQRVLVVNQPYDNHNAGQLAFGPDGMLYVGLGDGGSGNDPQNNGQNTNVLLGKMLRLDVSDPSAPYRVPADNPFVGRQGYRAEIWALGLRNPWRYAFDRGTGDLWIGDVGQNRLEEIDFQPASSKGGENYGWVTMEASQCVRAGCNTQGLVLPVFEYGRGLGVSVTGGKVYRGATWRNWRGIYFLADFGSGRFWGIRRNGSQFEGRELMVRGGWAISTFGEDEQGEIYFAEYGGGRIYRLADERPAPAAPVIESILNQASGEPGVVAGGRVHIRAHGVKDEPGTEYTDGLSSEEVAGIRVTFDGVAGGVVEVINNGGQEGITVAAPVEIAGRDRVAVVVSRDGSSSDPEEVHVLRVQPALYNGFPSEAAAGVETAFLATGFGAPLSDGSCPYPVEATVGGATADVISCGPSVDYAGVVELKLRIPAGLQGEHDAVVVVDGTASQPVRLLVL